jgi:glycosyltransferase involved in cell wall biosynthesis
MKIIHVSTSDSVGGAAKAAYRVHRALVDSGIDSRMWVLDRNSDDDRVGNVKLTLAVRLKTKFQNRLMARNLSDWHTDNPILHSFGKISAGLVGDLNASNADIVNLHWISGILSIKDIGRLSKPIVWRLADMWAFCGAEHYEMDTPTARFKNGYLQDNRPVGERGPDINRLVWNEKRRSWVKQFFTIVCTTNWLAKCARESELFSNMPIHVIPNPLEVNEMWKPIDKQVARIALNLPLDRKIILMGAHCVTNPIKGIDLLIEAVKRIASQNGGDFYLVFFGQGKPKEEIHCPCAMHWLGEVRDDRLLTLAYSAADVMVVPSRQEAFGQAASEAQACGTPVVAFDNSGPADIVIHRETGWLAKAFDTEDLAKGIMWVLSDEDRWVKLSQLAREKAVERFSPGVIAEQYGQVYEEVLSLKTNLANKAK